MSVRLNQIPMETWNHLKVNYAHEEFDLPSRAGARRDLIPDRFGEDVSSVGKDFDEYVITHADVTGDITVEEGKDRGTMHFVHDRGHVIYNTVDVASGGKIVIIRYLKKHMEDTSVLTKIRAGKDSQVSYIEVNLSDDSSVVRSGVSIAAEENARVEMVRIAFGGKAALYGAKAELTGKGSSFDLDTAYLADKAMSIDFNDISDFYGRETRSFLNSAGVLAGTAKKLLRNTVDFKRGSVYAVGHEKENVIMFSDDCINLTTPLILCGEEWVEGQHAATTTRLDENILYYLRSRGLSELEARKLVVISGYAPVIDKIPDQDIRDDVYEELNRRIDAIDEV